MTVTQEPAGSSDRVVLPTGRGGGNAYRVGQYVERSAEAWTPTIHAYLRHLERSGFQGAPRPIAIEGHREILTFIEGEVLANPEWQPGQLCNWPEWARSEPPLIGAAKLIRELHTCAAGFEPQHPIWREHEAPLKTGQIVCHADLGPHNTVYRDGLPIAFIDWDLAHPMEPILEFADAAWRFVPLGPEERFKEYGWEPLPDLPKRLGMFCAGYGVSDSELILSALQQCRQRNLERLRHFPIGPAEAAAYIRLVADELDWLDDNAHKLGKGIKAK